MDDRIALIGANGNGKSTLVKLLAKRLEAMKGGVRMPGKLRVGYFAQHQVEELDVTGTPYSHMAALMPRAHESKIRAQIGRFGFGQERADTRVTDLSGGEKARLLFALMSFHAPHLMLLDEPTNHLDVDAREALVEALNEYEGAVILVSHDAHLLELVCDRLWLVADGTCAPFDGDLDDYRRLLTEQRRAARRDDENGVDDRKARRRNRAEARERAAPLRRAAREAEKAIEKLGAEKTKIEAELAKPELYDGPAEKVTRLNTRLAEVTRALATAEEQWLESTDALEAALAED